MTISATTTLDAIGALVAAVAKLPLAGLRHVALEVSASHVVQQYVETNIEQCLPALLANSGLSYSSRVIDGCGSKALFVCPHPNPLPEGEGVQCCFTTAAPYNLVPHMLN